MVSEDDGFAPANGFDPNPVRDAFVSGIGDGGGPGKSSNPPQYSLRRDLLEGKPVLVIDIAENEAGSKPCYMTERGIARGSYKRVDDADIRLSAAELYEMQSVLIVHDDDASVVSEARATVFDQAIVDQIISAARKRDSRAVRDVSDYDLLLERLNFTNRDGGVRLCGLLVAGDYPQQYCPKLLVDVISYPQNVKGAAGRIRFLDRKLCEGPIATVIDDAIAAIERNLRTYSVVEGAGRKDVQEIPRVFLREAVANAVVHREYSPMFNGQAVSVEIYPDRVEITSPGGLWGGKTLETLDDGISRCRNARLMNLMGLLLLPHDQGAPAEGAGTGIGLMKREMAVRALPAPRFEAGIDYFRVILGRHGTQTAEFIRWLEERNCSDIPQHEKAILLAVWQEGELTVKQLRGMMGLDSDEIRGLASDLVSRGQLASPRKDLFTLLRTDALVVDGVSSNPETAIIDYLSLHGTASVRELSAAIGRTVTSTRYYINKLIGCGKVTPTASPTSVKRKYVLTADGR